MNPYLLFILTTLTLSYLLDLIVDILNLTHISPHLPQEFHDYYSPQKYKKSQQYLRATTAFSLIHSSILLPLSLTFILLGGFNSLDLLARSITTSLLPTTYYLLPETLTGLIFALLLTLLNTLVSLPFDLYSTFVIETRFGFNQTTLQTFALDLLKSLTLTLTIGAPIFTLLFYLFTLGGPDIWLLAWILTSLIQLFLTFIFPAFILPLFNKFTPLPPGELRTKIEKFAASQNFKLQGIYTMDGSRRSTKTNAFFTGFSRFKRIVLFDTLIKQHTPDELVSILAHEIGHYKKKHIYQMLLINTLISGFTFFLFSHFINNPRLFAAFRMDHVSVYASLIFIGILFEPLNDLLSIFILALSRRHELQADHFAVTTHQKPKTFIRALKKLSAHNLNNLTPHPLKVFLDYSHPTVLQRIHAINQKLNS